MFMLIRVVHYFMACFGEGLHRLGISVDPVPDDENVALTPFTKDIDRCCVSSFPGGIEAERSYLLSFETQYIGS